MTETVLDADFWNKRYLDGTTGWDLGQASPAIVDYFKAFQNKEIQILIPGCGNAYEAEALLELGYINITLIDLSEELVLRLQERLKDTGVKVIRGDFFDHQVSYDCIVEQTFFCALDPKLRMQYVNKMHELLNENGKIVGLMFNVDFEGGPPFGGNKSEYEELFSKKFATHIKECSTSVQPRMGSELWVEFKKI